MCYPCSKNHAFRAPTSVSCCENHTFQPFRVPRNTISERFAGVSGVAGRCCWLRCCWRECVRACVCSFARSFVCSFVASCVLSFLRLVVRFFLFSFAPCCLLPALLLTKKNAFYGSGVTSKILRARHRSSDRFVRARSVLRDTRCPKDSAPKYVPLVYIYI